MTTNACTHGMPSPATCFDCMEAGIMAPPPPKPTERRTGRAFQSRYDGSCPSCTLPIRQGEFIQRTTFDRYHHEKCVSDMPVVVA